MVHVFSVTSVMSDSLRCYGLESARILCPGDSPGKNIAVGRHSLLQEIFQTQGLNPCLLHFRQIIYHWATGKALRLWFSSIQFSVSVVSDYLWPHELQQARPPCPSPTPGVGSDSRPLSRWCHSAISSSVIPSSSCPQFLPASEFFSNEPTLRMRWPKYWSFSFSIIESKEHPRLISFRMD